MDSVWNYESKLNLGEGGLKHKDVQLPHSAPGNPHRPDGHLVHLSSQRPLWMTLILGLYRLEGPACPCIVVEL